MFKAVVMIAEGTGAGYGLPAHLYAGGEGIAMCKSPSIAISLARKSAERKMGDSKERQGIGRFVGLIPVFDEVRLYRGNKLILQDY